MRKIYGKFITQKRLGSGSFGEVWEAFNHTTGQKVALKLEPRNSSVPQLFFEAKLYSMFQASKAKNNAIEPCNNIPVVYATGQTESTNFMAMELLGKSLEDLLTTVPRFSQKTMLMLAPQMISCVEFVHRHHYIHRDIKPDNFAMGVGENSNKVYIIDFGLSKKYVDQTGRHIKLCGGKSLTGTARYASVYALEGKEQSRRDDMESLLYVWIYLMNGRLPWMGLPTTGRKKYDAILQKKRATRPEDLCSGLNKFFLNYFLSIRTLKFDEEPDYKLYRKMAYDALIEAQFPFDYHYDWVKAKVTRTTAEKPISLSNVQKENVQTRLSLMVSPPSKDKLISSRNSGSKDLFVLNEQSDSPPSNLILASAADNSSPSVEVPPISNIQIAISNTKPYVPPKTTRTGPVKNAPASNNRIPRPATKTSTAKKEAPTAKASAVKKEVQPPLTSRTTATVATSRAVKGTTKQQEVSARRTKEQKTTTTISAIKRQNDAIRPAKERTALFTATTSRHPVSYRTGTLPKWMMAPVTPRR